MSEKKKTPAEKGALQVVSPSRSSQAGGRPSRAAIKLLLVAAVVVGVPYAGWRMLRSEVAVGPHYRLLPENITVTPQPGWIKANVKADVLRDGSLDETLSILDDDLVQRIATAFAVHPWVADVKRVAKFSPPRVEVEVVYRRPVCMVEVPGGLYPVDIEGVLLPSADFTRRGARDYPRLTGIHPTTEGPVGTSWGDPRVAAAAELAAVLIDVWLPWGLRQIVPAEESAAAAGRDALSFELHTRGGTRILWGEAPQSDADSRKAAVAKREALARYIEQHGSLDGPSGPQQLDIRGGVAVEASPRTANRQNRD